MTVQTERAAVAEPPRTGDAGAPSPVRRLLNRSPLALLLFLMALVAQVGAQPLNNGDAWFHLRAGHLFWGSWSLWHPGAPTRFATSAWVPTQWSTEMLTAKVEDWFGLPGVAFFYGLVYLAFLVAVYGACRRLSGPLAGAVATGAAVFAASTTLSARPQVVSLVLIAVTVDAWWRTRADGRLRWWLLPMTWVWATAHGLWTAGVLVSLACWLGLALEGRLRGRVGRAFLVPLGSLVAATLTPLGPKLLLSQLAVSERTPMIAEWGATSFRTVPALVVGVMVAVLLVLWLRGERVGAMPLLLLVLACGWAALVTRLVAPAAVLVAPLLAQALTERLRRRTRVPTDRVERVVVALAALACVAGLAAAVPSSADRAAGVPDAFAPRLAALPRGSAVLVEDSSGAWMEWRFPGVQPVIDGLLDSYSVAYMRRFDTFWRAEPGWRGFVADSGARNAVMLAGSPATTALVEEAHWRVVQRDAPWVYLVAPGGAR